MIDCLTLCPSRPARSPSAESTDSSDGVASSRSSRSVYASRTQLAGLSHCLRFSRPPASARCAIRRASVYSACCHFFHAFSCDSVWGDRRVRSWRRRVPVLRTAQLFRSALWGSEYIPAPQNSRFAVRWRARRVLLASAATLVDTILATDLPGCTLALLSSDFWYTVAVRLAKGTASARWAPPRASIFRRERQSRVFRIEDAPLLSLMTGE